MERSRSRQNILLNATKIPNGKELSYEVEAHSSNARSKVVRKREGQVVLDIGEKEKKAICSSAKSDAVPEVEALLARLRAL